VLSIVVPTYNEAENIHRLLGEIVTVLGNMSFEVIIVDDDSPDRTWEIAQNMTRQKPWLRVIRRIGKRGLSSAAVDGFHAARGDVLAVMDSDGQHDPALLPRLFDAVQSGAVVAIGSRYIPGGSVEGWAHTRHFLSFIATGCAWFVCSSRIRDPMSGFFAIRRTVFATVASRLRPRGFKILLEILGVLDRKVQVIEIPLVFRLRRKGESKLDARIEIQFFLQILSLLWRRYWQLIIFCMLCIGLLAVLIPHAWSLRLLYVDASARSRVSEDLKLISEEQGWILSNISLLQVEQTGFRFVHREHRRGKDATDCYVYTFDAPSIRPCAEED